MVYNTMLLLGGIRYAISFTVPIISFFVCILSSIGKCISPQGSLIHFFQIGSVYSWEQMPSTLLQVKSRLMFIQKLRLGTLTIFIFPYLSDYSNTLIRQDFNLV